MKMQTAKLLLIACALALMGCGLNNKVPTQWVGIWAGNDGSWLKVTGSHWSTGYGEVTTYEGRLIVIDAQENRTLVDMPVEQGKTKGQTVKAIFRLNGDTLLYCGTYDLPRPTEFVKGAQGDPWFVEYKRGKK